MDRTITAPLLLGIDIGTTSLAAQVISADSGDCAGLLSRSECYSKIQYHPLLP